MKRTALIFSLIQFLAGMSLHAGTYTWTPKGDEPSFSLDIPADWETDYLVRSNGAIVFFRDNDAVIEARVFVMEEETDAKDLLNQKAARLSAHYNHVRLLKEGQSKYRSNVYLASWELSEKGKVYIEKTGFVQEGEAVLALSCLAPAQSYQKYRVIFDNATLSMKLEEYDRKGEGIRKIKELFLFNRPNDENGIAPGESQKNQSVEIINDINVKNTTSTTSTQTTTTNTTATPTTNVKADIKPETKTTIPADNFLPEVK